MWTQITPFSKPIQLEKNPKENIDKHKDTQIQNENQKTPEDKRVHWFCFQGRPHISGCRFPRPKVVEAALRVFELPHGNARGRRRSHGQAQSQTGTGNLNPE